MPCKTSPQQTMFAIVTRLELTIADWQASLSRVSTRLCERASDRWPDFELVRKDIESALQVLREEEEISLASGAPEALAILFEHYAEQRGRLAIALLRAEQALDRPAVLAQFCSADI